MLRENTSDGVRFYETTCMVALALLVLLLALRGLGGLVLIPLLFGLGGIVGRGRLGGQPLVIWRAAPVCLVLSVAGLLGKPLFTGWVGEHGGTLLEDLLLAAAVLGYVAAHYRLQGLEVTPLPRDPRDPSPRLPSGRPVSATELTTLVLEIALWAVLASWCWDLLPIDWYDLGLDPMVWRALLILWLTGMGILLGSAVLGYLARLRLSRGEAELLLQDLLWRETRGEQRRAARWLAWSRKKVD